MPKQWSWMAGTFGNICVDLHEQYGEIVRTAPNELSYIKPQAWRDIFGRPGKSEMTKDHQIIGKQQQGGWHLISAPHEDHARMRKLFTYAFSNTALVAQEHLLVQYADQMVVMMGEVMSRDGKVNMVDLFNFATFDIMAELAFGEPLGMLQNTDYIPWVRVIFAGLKFTVFRAVLVDIPVLGPVLNWLSGPILQRKTDEHFMFSNNLLAKRLSYTDHNKPDLWAFILQHNDDGKGLTVPEMKANAGVFMVAGTETTATTLSGAVYYLCKHPRVYKKLMEEIRATFKRSDEIALGPLGGMEYLNAVLREVLRIYVPGAGGFMRIVPPGGADICGEFVPGGTTVTMNHYSAYLNTVNFSDPWGFVPERWINTDSPRFASDRREVHEPFSYGARNCIGKKRVLES